MARRTKPPVADWIQRERKRLGLSVDQLVERLGLIGVHVGRQTIQVGVGVPWGNARARDNRHAARRPARRASRRRSCTRGSLSVAAIAMASRTSGDRCDNGVLPDR